MTQFLSDAIRADQADTSTPAKKFDVAIILHKGEAQDVDTVISELSAKAGLGRDAITVDHNHIHVCADGETLAKIADMDAVRSVQEIVPRTFFNNVARQDMFVPDYSAVSSEVAADGFTGAGQAVTVADTGFDLGSMTNVHPAFVGSNKESRVIDLIAVGRPKLTNDPRSHGTHVCGSVLGDGHSEKWGKIQGTAPKAELVMQSLLTQQGGLNTGANLWDTLFDPPYKKHTNARVHTNSWGADWKYAKRQLAYNSSSEDIDRFVWHRPDRTYLLCSLSSFMDPFQASIFVFGSPAVSIFHGPSYKIANRGSLSQRSFASPQETMASNILPLGHTLALREPPKTASPLELRSLREARKATASTHLQLLPETAVPSPPSVPGDRA